MSTSPLPSGSLVIPDVTFHQHMDVYTCSLPSTGGRVEGWDGGKGLPRPKQAASHAVTTGQQLSTFLYPYQAEIMLP